MKEIKDIIKAYHNSDFGHHKVALATVIHVEGSSYRRAGARMLVRDDGVYSGGISGGCLEGDALKKANYCMARNKVDLVRYDTTKPDEGAIGVGLGCNGIIDVLICPINPKADNNPIIILESCVLERKVNCLITVVESSAPEFERGMMIKYQKASFPFGEKVAKEVETCIQSRKSKVMQFDDFTLFLEVLPPAIHLVLFGNSYDIYPLLQMGGELGWSTSVVVKASKQTQKMKGLASQLYTPGEEIPIDEFTAFVLMAHDYDTDKKNLKMALLSQVPYVGMLGPAKRRDKALEELKGEGHYFTEDQLNKLYNPIGLDIGATTPEEIALSILAEIRAYFSGKTGSHLRDKAGPIHNR